MASSEVEAARAATLIGCSLDAEKRHVEILGYLLYVAKLVIKQECFEDGFRVVINDGPKDVKSVYHLHIHLLGGRQMNWPPG